MAAELEAEGTRDPGWAILRAKRFIDAGAYTAMIEAEGITENVKAWRTDVPAKIVDALGLEKVMFEAADPEVFAWYVKNYGPEVDLFVDHSQIVHLECLRSFRDDETAAGKYISFHRKIRESPHSSPRSEYQIIEW